MDRNADGPGLVRDGASDGLADPPRGVGRELVAALVFEFVHGLHEADVALLDQIQELQAAIGVLLGDGYDQAQVGSDEFLLGVQGIGIALADAPQDFFELLHVVHGVFLELAQNLDLAVNHFLEGKKLLHGHAELVGGGHGIDGPGVELLEDAENLVLGLAQGQNVGRQIALAVVHLAHVVAHGLDDAVDEGLFELDIPQALDHAFLVVHDLLLHAEDALVQGRALVEAGVEGALLAVDVLHILQKLDDPFALVHLFLGRIVFLDGLDHVLELHAAFLEVLADAHEFLDGHGNLDQGVHDFHLAGFDLLGDVDFAVTVQQADRAHLAQVHAHGIIAAHGIVRAVLVLGQLQLFLVLDFLAVILGDLDAASQLLVHDINVELIENDNDFVDLLRSVDFGRQGLVEFIEGQKALFLSLGNQRLNLLDVLDIAHPLPPKVDKKPPAP